MKKTIASRLFRNVFMFYILVATIVVGLLIVKEYSDTKELIIDELKSYQKSHSSILAEALWEMDVEELQFTIDGFLQNSQIVGVKILDHNSDSILAKVGKISIKGMDNEISSSLFAYTFPIDMAHESGKDRVGFAELYTSQAVIVKIIEFRVILVLVSVLIMIIALWVIFHSVSRVVLSAPLSRLTALSKNLELSNLDDYRNIESPAGSNELDILEDAFVAMIQRLRDSNTKLSDFHNELEQLVEERTESLKIEVAERKQIEKELLTQGSIVTNMLEGAYLVRASDGIIVYTNAAFETMFGYSTGEMLGKHISIVNAPTDKSAEEVSTEINAFLHKNKSWQGEILNQKKDGTKVWSYATITTISHPEFGEVWVSINTNIAHLKQQEEDLVKAKNAAEAATQAKSNFLSTMSHEIRTPMNGVLGMVQLLEDTPLNVEQKGYLDIILNSGNSLLTIINDILDFSKLDTQKVELEHFSFDLERLCHDCMELVSVKIVEKKLDLVLDYAPDCPRFWTGDPSRIRQVLLNLLGNAIKFTHQGFIRLGIKSITADTGKQLLRIEVEDSGIGIKPAAIKHLFDHFTQADQATTRQYGGTGLGLAITRELITLMGGELGVDSTYGEGSTFWVNGILPMSGSVKKVPIVTLQGVRILLAYEKNHNRRCVFEPMLKHIGVQTTVVNHYKQVVETLITAVKQKNPFSICIIDHARHPDSALELAKNIRKDNQLNDLKLLAISSVGLRGDTSIMKQAGFNAYLNKISRYETLQVTLQEIQSHILGDSLLTQHTIEETTPLITHEDVKFDVSVLLVEDIIPNQLIAKKFLQKLGVTVDVANNGQQAVELYKNNNYHLIFMDCRMPVMDGYEATRVIRKLEQENNKPAIPIIALTANASHEDKVLCKQTGMNDVVTKPFKRNDLLVTLEKWLNEPLL